MTKTAFIGLGVMGFPMAGHKTAQGHEVTVYNRTIQKAQKWAKNTVEEWPRPRAKRLRAQKSSAPVSAMTMTSEVSLMVMTVYWPV